MRKAVYMGPKRQKYQNSGELFEETIGDLYGTPEPDDDDDEKEDDEDDDE